MGVAKVFALTPIERAQHLANDWITIGSTLRRSDTIQRHETARSANCSLATLRATIEHGIRIGERKAGNPAKALSGARIFTRKNDRDGRLATAATS